MQLLPSFTHRITLHATGSRFRLVSLTARGRVFLPAVNLGVVLRILTSAYVILKGASHAATRLTSVVADLRHALALRHHAHASLFVAFGMLAFLATLYGYHSYVFVTLAAGTDHAFELVGDCLIGRLLSVLLLLHVALLTAFRIRVVFHR